MSDDATPEVFRPPATAFPIFIQLKCLGEDYQLWAQQIVDTLDGYDAARVALTQRAESVLRSHERNAEGYTFSWEIFDDPLAVGWARHLFGPAGAESFILTRLPAAQAEDDAARPRAASPAPFIAPATISLERLDNPAVIGLAERLCTAAIAFQGGVTYQTAERWRRGNPSPAGTKWRALALVSLEDWLPVVSERESAD